MKKKFRLPKNGSIKINFNNIEWNKKNWREKLCNDSSLSSLCSKANVEKTENYLMRGNWWEIKRNIFPWIKAWWKLSVWNGKKRFSTYNFSFFSYYRIIYFFNIVERKVWIEIKNLVVIWFLRKFRGIFVKGILMMM